MRFLSLRLQNFRNIEFAELPLSARNYLLGANGQGNLIYWKHLGWRLRSVFSYANAAALPRKGVKEYAGLRA